MSDEKTIDAEVVAAVESGVTTSAEDGLNGAPLDKVQGRRSSAATVRLARTGAILANGADSVGAAMVAAGYSEWTARNPTENGVTVARALKAAAEVFPAARKTLRSLRPKAIEALDRSLTLQEGERPDQGHLQAAGLALKLAQEANEDGDDTEAEHGEVYYRRLRRRACLHAWLQGARFAAQHGLEAALAHAIALSERTDERAPYLDAQLPPRGNVGPLQTVFMRKGQ